jgi:hypothetical protein
MRAELIDGAASTATSLNKRSHIPMGRGYTKTHTQLQLP